MHAFKLQSVIGYFQSSILLVKDNGMGFVSRGLAK